MMTEPELQKMALERARAKFHGLSCAVMLHLNGQETLNLSGLLEMLREGNRLCANALGYRGPQGIEEVERMLCEEKPS